MLAIAGGMALLLGVVGIYGVISYSVSQRTREIGIRMALGAPQAVLMRMFVGHGMRLAAAGVACGLTAAVAFMRLMSSLLFEVSPLDPVTYAEQHRDPASRFTVSRRTQKIGVRVALSARARSSSA
jgi:ABC-type antimicrobial peptide transport system permease subunit